MIELAFVACLSFAPDTCEKKSLLFTDVTPMQCVRGAQPELAKWVSTHQNWRIASWKCRTFAPGEKDV